METPLDFLITALTNSEKAAEDERNKCKKARRNIQAEKEQLKMESQMSNELSEEIIKLENTLNDAESNKEMELTELYLNEKITELRSENLQSERRLTDLQEMLRMKKMKLMSDVKEFSENYSFLSTACASRRRTTLGSIKSDLDTISKEMGTLESDNTQLKQSVTEAKQALEQKSHLQRNIDRLKSEQQDILAHIREEETEMQKIHAENMELEQALEAGIGFSQLSDDLKRYDTQELEERFEQLEAELAEVNDTLRRQEERYQQLQYKRWQRQREQQHRQNPDTEGEDCHNNNYSHQETGAGQKITNVAAVDPHRDRPGFASISSTEPRTTCFATGYDKPEKAAGFNNDEMERHLGAASSSCEHYSTSNVPRENSHSVLSDEEARHRHKFSLSYEGDINQGEVVDLTQPEEGRVTDTLDVSADLIFSETDKSCSDMVITPGQEVGLNLPETAHPQEESPLDGAHSVVQPDDVLLSVKDVSAQLSLDEAEWDKRNCSGMTDPSQDTIVLSSSSSAK